MSGPTPAPGWLRVIDLGRIAYKDAYELQLEWLGRVLDARRAPDGEIGTAGVVLLLEHDPPVITVSRRPDARSHLIATDKMLAAHGVTIEETDRGGDITYHGPGQLVAYPIVDLNSAGLNLHAYMRLLESAVIQVCAAWGIDAHRDSCATGVWVGGEQTQGAGGDACARAGGAKICALGVRVRRWVTMHGLALNVRTNLEHFGLIVPCGLAGRSVTSMEQEVEGECPAMDDVKRALASELAQSLERHAAEA